MGLGHEFLAHLERARLLIHLVEAAPEAADVRRRLAAIDRELELHGGGLADRPQLIVLSKIDLIEPAERAALIAAAGAEIGLLERDRRGHPGAGRRALPRMPEADPAETGSPRRPRSSPTTSSTARGRPSAARFACYATTARCASPAVRSRRWPRTSTPMIPATPRGLRAELERLDVEPALRNAGAKPGDDVLVGPHRLTYQRSDRERALVRIGVFGGEFDPPHVGHLVIAQEARYRLELDRLLVVPPASPPHRTPSAVPAGDPPADGRGGVRRRAWTRRSAGSSLSGRGPVTPWTRSSSWPRRTSSCSWCWAPISWPRSSTGTGPTACASWRSWPSPGGPEWSRRAAADIVLTSPLLDVSSTEIRRRIAAGAPVHHLVPEAVLELIQAEGLYVEGP